MSKFFTQGHDWTTHSRLTPVIKVAKMPKQHLKKSSPIFCHGITNAISQFQNTVFIKFDTMPNVIQDRKTGY